MILIRLQADAPKDLKMYENDLNVLDKHKIHTVEELQKIQKSETLPFAICAMNIMGDLNIGTMIRTATLLGAEKFFIYGRRHYDRRSTVGAHNYIEVDRYTPYFEEDTYAGLKEFDYHLQGYYPILIETGGESLLDFIYKMDHLILNKMKPCLVFGSESKGLPKNFCYWYQTFSIPQLGVMRNFNVSAAMSIMTWELYKVFEERAKLL